MYVFPGVEYSETCAYFHSGPLNWDQYFVGQYRQVQLGDRY